MDKKQHCYKLYEKAKTGRTVREPEMEAAYNFTYPASNLFNKTTSTAIDRTKIWDSTAIQCVSDVASSLMRLMIPFNKMWVTVEPTEELREQTLPPDIERKIESANRKIYETLNSSGFYLSANEAMIDCIVTGNGCVSIYEDESGISILCSPMYQMYFLSNSYGKIDSIFKKHRLTAKEVVMRYGDRKGYTISDEIRKVAEDQPLHEYELLEAVYPVSLTAYSYSILIESNPVEMIYDREIRWDQIPHTPFRWQKIAGDDYGDGPITASLPNINTLNELYRDILKFTGIAAFGLWQSQSHGYNSDRHKGQLKEGEIIYTDEEIIPLQFPGNINHAINMVEGERAQIRELTMASELPPADQPNYMTAAEVQVRQTAYLKRIGHPVLRLQKEFLEPFAERLVAKMVERGELPKDILNKAQFKIVVNSAASAGIKQSEAYDDLQIFAQIAATVGPEQVAKVVDMNAFTKRVMEDSGFSRSFFRTPEQIEQLEQQQQMMQAAQLAMSGKAPEQSVNMPAANSGGKAR